MTLTNYIQIKESMERYMYKVAFGIDKPVSLISFLAFDCLFIIPIHSLESVSMQPPREHFLSSLYCVKELQYFLLF